MAITLFMIPARISTSIADLNGLPAISLATIGPSTIRTQILCGVSGIVVGVHVGDAEDDEDEDPPPPPPPGVTTTGLTVQSYPLLSP